MKMNIKRFALILSIISFNLFAQTETNIETFNFDAWIEQAPNGAWIAAGEDYDTDDAFVEVHIPDGTVQHKNFLHTEPTEANSWSTRLDLGLYNGTIATNNNYFFVEGITSHNSSPDLWWHSLCKYDFINSHENPLIEKTIKQGAFKVFYINNDFVIILYKKNYYDQMSTDWNLSSIPNNTYCMFIIDENGDKGSNPVYQLPSEPYILYKDVLQELPSGNIGVNLHNGDFIEVDLSTGTFVQTINEGMEETNTNLMNDDGTSIQGGLDENDDIVTKLYDINGDLLYKTDMPNPNFNNFGFRWDTAKNIDGVYYMTRGSGYFTLGSTLMHGEIHTFLSDYEHIKISYANDDGSYTFIIQTDDHPWDSTTQVWHVVPPTPVLPLLNASSDTNIQAVFDGQIYNFTTNTWEDAFYQSTMAVTTLPDIGSTANSNWVYVPSGYTLVGYFPVEEIERNGETLRLCRGQFKKNGYTELIDIQIRFELASEVMGLNEIDINEFSIYPVPMTNTLNIRTEKQIIEILIYDVLGREVLNKNFDDLTTDYAIDTSKLNNGTYSIKIKTKDNRIAQGKLIK